jgi:hypothetical protein
MTPEQIAVARRHYWRDVFVFYGVTYRLLGLPMEDCWRCIMPMERVAAFTGWCVMDAEMRHGGPL